ncbi:uncharacterized protein LOC113310043 [Papaver somniferum]|uniref:uncharacterized protein LOC113310043 n=1 Tax=Papaver somniferum TaxID=3469 RepID=UPI000E6FFE2C|nr:uncharacterized protein LOC113310043 [Papaver somniferum]
MTSREWTVVSRRTRENGQSSSRQGGSMTKGSFAENSNSFASLHNVDNDDINEIIDNRSKENGEIGSQEVIMRGVESSTKHTYASNNDQLQKNNRKDGKSQQAKGFVSHAMGVTGKGIIQNNEGSNERNEPLVFKAKANINRDTNSKSGKKLTTVEESNGSSNRTPQHLFTRVAGAISGGVDGRGYSGEPSSSRVGSNGGRLNGGDIRPNIGGGSTSTAGGGNRSAAPTDGFHATKSGALTKPSEFGWNRGEGEQNLKAHKAFQLQLESSSTKGVSKRREGRGKCHSKNWLEATRLEMILAPLVETPALVRGPKGLWRIEMDITTCLDLDVPLILTQASYLSIFFQLLTLWLPVGASRRNVGVWDMVVERMAKKLAP